MRKFKHTNISSLLCMYSVSRHPDPGLLCMLLDMWVAGSLYQLTKTKLYIVSYYKIIRYDALQYRYHIFFLIHVTYNYKVQINNYYNATTVDL